MIFLKYNLLLLYYKRSIQKFLQKTLKIFFKFKDENRFVDTLKHVMTCIYIFNLIFWKGYL